MSLIEGLVLLVATIGTLFMLISAIGIVRLPDVYARMHAAGKASTLGVACILLSAGLYFSGAEFFRMVLLIALLFITAPVAVTTMARAAYRSDRERRFVLHYDDMETDSARQASLANESTG